jgi:tetratricopeptide (TPR) repeat protein
METESPTLSEKFKEKGNEFFRKHQYMDAIRLYTKAIEINKNESTYFSNRARCWQILLKFDKSYEDALEAVELNDKNIKAHKLVGESLAELGKLDSDTKKM